MSALHPIATAKADMCAALADVCYGPKADLGDAANAVSSYPFFAGREGRSLSVPIWLEVDRLTRTHILNKDIAKHKALIDSASSAQTHRKPSVHFRQTNFRS
jgi:hypothetical protein